MISAFLISLAATVGTEGEIPPAQAISAKFWQALSHEPDAAADVKTLRQLFHPQAQVFGSTPDPKAMSVRAVEEFLQAVAKPKEKGFYECEIAREVRQYGPFATLYSLVESRRESDQREAEFVGINSLQLRWLDGRWQILSLHYQLELPDMPLTFAGAVSGQCLP
ncbi:nuclear transport factor 2 family protein [Aliiglaciecola sp. CAU 1673]|uniref:nuclear transport factor 2 family protein n=1 Tax=Aliiglaciecola sp. CAU 1673 TaxID=3032595 RepID=UPI0023DBCA68|nr:nuclear transport factor 2 family protein [Aliiglaciecola sp. CAU 1673]MDF2179209.1 nuclear transport factor 2 family protein [Aliiglaciecola sp. CAU 1673]